MDPHYHYRHHLVLISSIFQGKLHKYQRQIGCKTWLRTRSTKIESMQTAFSTALKGKGKKITRKSKPLPESRALSKWGFSLETWEKRNTQEGGERISPHLIGSSPHVLTRLVKEAIFKYQMDIPSVLVVPYFPFNCPKGRGLIGLEVIVYCPWIIELYCIFALWGHCRNTFDFTLDYLTPLACPSLRFLLEILFIV